MATNSAPLRTAGIEAAREYQDLPAWQKALSLVEALYAAEFRTSELKALAIDAALNIATRIAAASVRPSEVGIAAGYQEAQGSAAELSTMLVLAERLGLENATTYTELLDEVSRLLVGMRHGLKVKAKDEEYNARQEARRDQEHEERQYKPKREFKSRDGEDRPRREYKPRDGGEDRPRREYKPRDGGDDRPRREYKPREDKPYGDRKPYGDKKPYGEKKPYGDKKPYGGGKPFRKPRRDD